MVTATLEKTAAPNAASECIQVDSHNEELAEALKLFSDPTRLQLLGMLARKGEMHVNAMCSELGQSQPAVSHHLALLRMAKLVTLRRQGKFNFYRNRQATLDGLVNRLSEVFEQPPLTI